MSSTVQASVFMGKNYLENLHYVRNTGKDLTMKQMFDKSEKLVDEQSDEIYGVNTINWCDSSWTHLSLIGDEESSVSRTRMCAYFQILCYAWKDEREPTIKYCLGGQVDVVQKFITIQSFGHK